MSVLEIEGEEDAVRFLVRFRAAFRVLGDGEKASAVALMMKGFSNSSGQSQARRSMPVSSSS